MKNIKIQLISLSAMYGIAFLDGALSLGLSEGFYTLLGLGMVANIVWMWVDYSRGK